MEPCLRNDVWRRGHGYSARDGGRSRTRGERRGGGERVYVNDAFMARIFPTLFLPSFPSLTSVVCFSRQLHQRPHQRYPFGPIFAPLGSSSSDRLLTVDDSGELLALTRQSLGNSTVLLRLLRAFASGPFLGQLQLCSSGAWMFPV